MLGKKGVLPEEEVLEVKHMQDDEVDEPVQLDVGRDQK